MDVFSVVERTISAFVVFKSGDELQQVLQEEQKKPVLTDLLGDKARKFGSALTQIAYMVNTYESKIQALQSHPAIANIYEGEIPPEQIKTYVDCGVQAGASIWNGRFGKKGYIAGNPVDGYV